MNYLEVYKLVFGWFLVFSNSLVYFIGYCTLIRWLWIHYFKPLLSLSIDMINQISKRR